MKKLFVDAAQAKVRLHKIIARTGVLSLRAAERAIIQGRVSVNGAIVSKLGVLAGPGDDIRVDGKKILTDEPHVYLMMYKPSGYVTTKSDEEGRRTVMDLLPKEYSRLFPVGRLDINSEGLLMLSNDGEFCQAMLAPKNRIERVYHVKVRNLPEKKILDKMVSGITVEGEKLKVGTVRLLSSTEANARLEITLGEGKKRHIRRLCETLGHPAIKIKRVAFGPLKLGALKPGDIVHVPLETISAIKKMAYKASKRK
jgi:pseudouridine synthase